MSKKALTAALVVCALFATLMIFTAAFAQTIPKPSIPEFTLKFVDKSYYIPPTYGIDQFTGKNVTIQAGDYFQNRSVEVIISNQPFSRYKDANGNNIALFYDVRWKGHFSDSWSDLVSSGDTYNVASSSLMADNELLYPNSSSTALYYGLGGNNATNDYIYNGLWLGNVPGGGQIDFQVQAYIGYYTVQESTPGPLFGLTQNIYQFNGESSGWSNTTTITMPLDSASPQPTTTPSSSSTSIATASPTLEPTSSPSIPELSPWIILPLVIVASVLAVAWRRRKKKA